MEKNKTDYFTNDVTIINCFEGNNKFDLNNKETQLILQAKT